jgi:tetratricopeptide (TPR) repeat protein
LNSFSQAFNDIEWYDADSLLKVLPVQVGPERLQTLNALAASLSFEDKKECRYYAQQALDLSEELNNTEKKAAALRNFGRMEFYDGNYPMALNYYLESMKIYEAIGNRYLVAQLLEDLGTTHFFAKNFEKTFELVHQSLAVYRSRDSRSQPSGNVRDTMSIYSRVGLPYRMTGRSDISRTIYLNYIKIGKEHQFEITDMMLHNGLLAMCYYEIGNYDSAFYYFGQAANYPDTNMSIRALKHEHKRRMASIHLKLGNTDSAIRLFKDAYQWFAKRGFLKQSQMASRQLGDIYLNMGNFNDANFYFQQSATLLKEMMLKSSYYRYDSLKYVVSWGSELYLPFTKKLIKEAIFEQAILLYDHMYQLYLNQNQLKLAMDYLIASSDAKDTLRLLTSNRESIEIQTKYETERKDTEILSLSQENKLKEMQLSQTRWLMVGLGGLVVLVILFAIVLIRQNKLRNSQQTLLFQQRLLRTQMNPHFLFNSLASIQNFIIKEKPALASDYLSRFSKLVRQILNNSVEEWVPLEDEIESIKNYLELQKVRHRDMFDYSIDVDEAIDPETIQVPPMLAQPFIENSIEHGFKQKNGKGHLKIQFKKNGKLIRFELEDDGIGREKAMQIVAEQNRDHRSMSTDITRQRLKVLNKKTRQKINLSIVDLKNDKGEPTGTRVMFDIPFKN